MSERVINYALSIIVPPTPIGIYKDDDLWPDILLYVLHVNLFADAYLCFFFQGMSCRCVRESLINFRFVKFLALNMF